MGDGRLATWWQAIEANEVCSATVDEYAAAVDGFLDILIGQSIAQTNEHEPTPFPVTVRASGPKSRNALENDYQY